MKKLDWVFISEVLTYTFLQAAFVFQTAYGFNQDVIYDWFKRSAIQCIQEGGSYWHCFWSIYLGIGVGNYIVLLMIVHLTIILIICWPDDKGGGHRKRVPQIETKTIGLPVLEPNT